MKKQLLLITILFFISSCSSQINTQDSIDKGLNFLAQAKTNGFSYNDEYLKYVYPGESLECPLNNCKITYRKLDAYFNLKFIKNDFQDYSLIKQDVEEADKILTSLIPIWRNKKLYNIVNETMLYSFLFLHIGISDVKILSASSTSCFIKE